MSNRTIFLEDISTEEMKALSKYDSDILAAALVFVVSELMIIQESPLEPPKLQDLVKRAGTHALELAEGVHLITTDKNGRETIH